MDKKKHILFFIHSLSAGGAERVTTTLANYWAKKGWIVTIVTIKRGGYEFYSLDSGVKTVELGLDRYSKNIIFAAVNNLLRVYALRRIIKKAAPDVVIGMMTTANVIVSLAKYGLPVLTIGSERIYPPAMPLGRIWEFARRSRYSRLSTVIAQTEQAAEWLRRNTSAHRIAVIPNPANYPLSQRDPYISPASIQPKSSQQKIILAVGRLVIQKGFDRLIEAFSSVSSRHPNWRLVILGEGPCRAKLEQQCRVLGIFDKVWLAGVVGNMGDWFKAADLYVLASRFEGFPNTLLEAMSYGLPAIAVDCETGPREIIRHQVDGLLVPQDNQAELVSALDCMMNDHAMRKRFGEKAIEVRERFSLSRIAGMWEALFRDV